MDMTIEPTLEYAFQATLHIADIILVGSAGAGGRGFANVLGGKIEGPLLNGRAIPNTGGDYPRFRGDGVIEFEAAYLLEADDGTPILINNRGYRHGSAEVLAALRERQEVDPASYYMRLSPMFEVAEGPHDWLTRHVIIGTGARYPDKTVFRYYIVR
jgi:hypothetical protein